MKVSEVKSEPPLKPVCLERAETSLGPAAWRWHTLYHYSRFTVATEATESFNNICFCCLEPAWQKGRGKQVNFLAMGDSLKSNKPATKCCISAPLRYNCFLLLLISGCDALTKDIVCDVVIVICIVISEIFDSVVLEADGLLHRHLYPYLFLLFPWKHPCPKTPLSL